MKNQKALTAEEILAVEDTVIEAHPVPQWQDRVVYVRSISAAERGQVEADAAKFRETKGKNSTFAEEFTVQMAWRGMCDQQGKRLFDTREQLVALKKKNAAAIAGIAEHIQRLSGFSKEDLQELEKNSLEAQPADSLSA
jgi:hypothetical protein